jgi:superfamily I DNA and/or RNA helicase
MYLHPNFLEYIGSSANLVSKISSNINKIIDLERGDSSSKSNNIIFLKDKTTKIIPFSNLKSVLKANKDVFIVFMTNIVIKANVDYSTGSVTQ